MFSKDRKHYRPTPRTMNEAFGPYHVYRPYDQRKADANIICAAVGVIILGASYGLMFVWGWV